MITKGPWKWVQDGWYTSDGRFQPSSPRGDLMPDWEGDGCMLRIAKDVSREDAEYILSLVNAQFDKQGGS